MVGNYSPARIAEWLVPGRSLFLAIHILGVACFSYIVARRLVPLFRAKRDFRFDRPLTRLGTVLKFWLGQWKHPRYKTAGIIHLLIFPALFSSRFVPSRCCWLVSRRLL